MSSTGSRAAFLAAFTVVALVGLTVGRAVTQSRAELKAAEAYREKGQLFRAIEHYRRSLRWSFPLSPFRGEAISGLESAAVELEEAGDVPGALLALRSLVGGVAASRFIYSGLQPRAERAKDDIARLLSRGGGAAVDANLGMDELGADHRRLLERAPSPQPLFGTMLVLGFALWVGSLVLVINRGFNSAGQLQWQAARAPLFGALGGLVSFVVGLLFA